MPRKSETSYSQHSGTSHPAGDAHAATEPAATADAELTSHRHPTYDYIIVGAGSAGSVLANRLTADLKTRVLVLEAGGSDRHPYIAAPVGFMKLITDTRFNWNYTTEASDTVKGREIPFPRGRALGGSSSINGSLYVRGQPRDYDTWAQMGNQGWSYADVLPYFRASETRPNGDPAVRGQSDGVHVSDIHEQHPLCDAFLDGMETLGIARNSDYNDGDQEGVAYYQRTIRNGRRHSAATAFLKPAAKRTNLHIVSDALVTNLTMDGRRVTGVTYRRYGQTLSVQAGRSVIMSGGAINSPQILQLAGIGPANLLQQYGIAVRHDLSGVGEGFQDHYAARIAQRVINQTTLNERARGVRLLWEIAKWCAAGKGLLGFSPAHVGAFLKSHPDLELPDLQFVFTPASYRDGVIGQLESTPGMTTAVWQMRPESKGYVRICSPDPDAPPKIQPNYLAAEADQQAIVQGLRMCRTFLETAPLAPYRNGESLPGADVQTDAELLDYARTKGGTVYHAVSTCRMGTDPMAVVGPDLKVHGLEGLRVVDASVMPTMPSANTNAATLMIAEKAAAMLRAQP